MMPPPTGDTNDSPPLTQEQVNVGDVMVLIVCFAAGRPANGSSLSLVMSQLALDRPCHVVLDLGHVDQVQGPFFGELLKMMKLLRGSGGTLKLCHLRPAIYDVLRVTRMEKLFEVQPDRATALATLAPPAGSPPNPPSDGNPPATV